ncbi:MAG TPA: 50S ribosomal protein L11 methyltransferase [Desulfomonilaceae bacterium]|nr:50S ribosomal protein L11 methyltransferase [Desulfomonilaceae bacterium]
MLITTADGIRGPFDIVAANLAAPTLLKLHSSLRSLTGGALVLSGIADAMIGEVLAVYDSGGLELVTRLEREGWHAALLGRNRPHERK